MRGYPSVPLHVGDIPILGLRQENQANVEAHRRDYDRVPEAGVDVARRCNNGEHGGWQEPAEPAVTDMVRQREPAIADAGREQFHQPGGDRRVDQGDVNHQDHQQEHRHHVVDLGRVRGGRVAAGGNRLAENLREVWRVGRDRLIADFDDGLRALGRSMF